VFAVGAKLRRVGPMTSASGAYCIVEPSFREGGWGEVFAVAGARDASVVWAEGFHSGWNARMRAGRGSARHFRHREGSVPPLGEKSLPLSGGERKENCVAIQAPSFGRERPLVARALSTSQVLLGLSWWYPRGQPFIVLPRGGTHVRCGVCMSVSVVPRTGAWRWRWGAVGACPPRRPLAQGHGVGFGGFGCGYLWWTRGEGLLGAWG